MDYYVPESRSIYRDSLGRQTFKFLEEGRPCGNRWVDGWLCLEAGQSSETRPLEGRLSAWIWVDLLGPVEWMGGRFMACNWMNFPQSGWFSAWKWLVRPEPLVWNDSYMPGIGSIFRYPLVGWWVRGPEMS